MAKNLTMAAPHFLVRDVVAAAEHYRDKFGFEIGEYFFEDPPVFVMVSRDGVFIQLARMEASRGGSNRNWRSVGIDCYIWVNDVLALYEEFKAKGVDIIAPPIQREYGMRELEVRDLDGYTICFGQDTA